MCLHFHFVIELTFSFSLHQLVDMTATASNATNTIAAQEVPGPSLDDLANVAATWRMSASDGICEMDRHAMRHRISRAFPVKAVVPEEVHAIWFVTPLYFNMTQDTPIKWISQNNFNAVNYDITFHVPREVYDFFVGLEQCAKNSIVADYLPKLSPEVCSALSPACNMFKSKTYLYTPNPEASMEEMTSIQSKLIPVKKDKRSSSSRFTLLRGEALTSKAVKSLIVNDVTMPMICIEGFWISSKGCGLMTFVRELIRDPLTPPTVLTMFSGERVSIKPSEKKRRRITPTPVNSIDSDVATL